MLRLQRWAQLDAVDGAFALYASRRRLTVWSGRVFALYASRRRLMAWPGGGGGGGHSWMGSLLSQSLAAELGPGLEAVEEGSALDGEFALYAFRRELMAWPGGGGRGLHSWTGILPSTPLAADFGPGLARRRRQRGVQLDSGIGSCSLSLPIPCPTDFWPGWPGKEAVAEESAAGRDVCFIWLLQPCRLLPQAGPEAAAEGCLVVPT